MRAAKLGLLLTLVASACSCGRPPATRYYLLELAPAAAPRSPAAAGATGPSIGVRSFDVRPPYDQDRIVYRIGESSPEVGFYAYHRWAAPLSRMLTGLVVESFRGAPELATITPAGSGERHDCYVEGTLVRLEELDVGDRQKVRVRLELTLRSSGGMELWSDSVEADSATRATGVEEIVAEMASLLGRELTAVRPAVAAAFVACAPGRSDD